MEVFVTGATGLVGAALTQRLVRDGHQVIAWVREVDAARVALGREVQLVAVGDGDDALASAIRRADAIVNLAGAPVARRWTDAYRRTLVDSRVGVTRRLVAAIGKDEVRPKVLVSASAVGWYGDRGDEELDEGSAAGTGFLAELCVDWEAAAHQAEAFGVRVCCPRIGVVLDGDGGALVPMRRAFSLGLGAAIGSGRQFMPFIHLADLVELLVRALDDDRYRGPINAVAPQAVTNLEFTRTLAAALGRSAWLRAPALAVRLGMGRSAAILLHSQRVVPRRALELGFDFRFPELAGALKDVL